MILTYFRIAARNVLKNRRRSLVTISSIALGFASLTLFAGYVTSTFKQLRLSAVVQEGLGHLTIYKKGWREQGTIHPEKYMLTEEELNKVVAIAKTVPGVRLASPKLNLAGLLSNGNVSTIFIAEGVDPADHNRLIQEDDSLVKHEFDATKPIGVHMAEGLAKALGLRQGAQAMLTGPTLEASMNAVNVEVARTFNTGLPETNDKFIRMPVALAQELLDTKRADRVMVLLDGFDSVPRVKGELSERLAAAGLHTDIVDWEELSAGYRGTVDMLSMFLTFMGTIVLVIVVMSVINTMTVSVVERTREIGTLRVIGLRRAEAAKLFAVEGALLGLAGSIAGLAVHTLAWAGIALAKPTYLPPGVSEPVQFIVEYVPAVALGTCAVLVVFALLAAISPARRAAKQDMVVALGYV